MPTERDEALAQPTRARLFAMLSDLRRPAGIEELADATGLHRNGVRIHLNRLADAGLLVKSRVSGGRGRPREEFAVAPDALPGGQSPQAYRELARWLGRAVASARVGLSGIEREGRNIGRDIAPGDGRPAVAAMQTALAALGFQPHARQDDDGVIFELGNCPYRDAVRENQPLICTLHRGISRGLLDELAPDARLRDFVARDPYEAGCLIEVDGIDGEPDRRQ